MVDWKEVGDVAKSVATAVTGGWKDVVISEQFFEYMETRGFTKTGYPAINTKDIMGKKTETRVQKFEFGDKMVKASVTSSRSSVGIGAGAVNISLNVSRSNTCAVKLEVYPKGLGFFKQLFAKPEKVVQHGMNMDDYINSSMNVISQPKLNGAFEGFLGELGFQLAGGKAKTTSTPAANPKAVAYIQQNNGQYGKADINAALKSAGYTAKEIETAWEAVGG